MKKKGLLISTIVMVVVLIASLTTATYAWFTVSDVTTIKGFELSVKSNNAVNIGIKTDYNSTISSSTNEVSPSHFVSGDVTFTPGSTKGSPTNPGSWGGTSGLSATLNHNINWTSQTKAVGVSTNQGTAGENNAVTGVGIDDTKYWTSWTSNDDESFNTDNKKTVVAANGNDSALTGTTYANANITKGNEESGDSAGDYVHFILGVTPNKALQRNSLVIAVTPTGGATLGVLASIHVAYRVTTADATEVGAWKEVDVYGDKHQNNSPSDVTAISGTVLDAYKASLDRTSAPAGTACVVIDGLDTAVNKITQVEIVIYMAGADSDCKDTGKTSQGNINLFFDTALAISATKAETQLTVNCQEKSYKSDNTKIYVSTSDSVSATVGSTLTVSTGITQSSDGSWSDGVYTATVDAGVKTVIVTDKDNKVLSIIKLTA